MISNFMILGDSYSTHKDFIPEGYRHYYCTGGRSAEEPVTNMLPEQTWWGRLIKATGARLVLNNSWSGSTIGYTGYTGDCSHSNSFIYRYRQLLESGFFEKEKIDTIFVFGGTNDSWCNAPLGEETYGVWQESDLFKVRPAICHLLSGIKKNHPDKRVIVIGNCDIKAEVTECLKNAAAHVGAEYLGLVDIDKQKGHPTVLGMEQIFLQVYRFLNSK